MPYTIYDSTIVVAQGNLKTLSHILTLASQSPNADQLLSARLHADMLPLPDQIRIACQFSSNLCARLTNTSPTTFTEPLTSFSAFQERITLVLGQLSKAEKEVVNVQAEEVKSTPMGPQQSVDMSGAVWAHSIVLPNVYFHLATAYGILRKEGVVLSKLDYYQGFLGGLKG